MNRKHNPHRQRLGILEVQKAINQKSGKPAPKSVPTPCAQTARLCTLGNDQVTLAKQVQASLIALKNSNPPCWLIAMILLESGCRVSEVLTINSASISPQGRVMIKGKKGSNDRIIHPITIAPQMIKLRKRNGPIFAEISRFHVYRAFRSVGLSHIFDGRSKASVTHLFRHLVAIDLELTQHGKAAITTGLGHKSAESADHYAHKGHP